MKSLPTKLRLVFLPFLLITAGYIGVWTFLDWRLLVRHTVFRIRLETGILVCLIILPWLPLLLLLRPRLKRLGYRNDEDKARYGLLMIAWVTILIPGGVAQEWLQMATGSLTQLTSIAEFARHPATKYYLPRRTPGLLHSGRGPLPAPPKGE